MESIIWTIFALQKVEAIETLHQRTQVHFTSIEKPVLCLVSLLKPARNVIWFASKKFLIDTK